ncbi:hypothetical protein SCP_1301780 [Sparassis crispa]|uniref:Uncharacterized protein n=1 Tax=Sparassis crispa TaxID=139825 RepID=A0A401H1U2_9APHY|nr:hypothetical protein SCP_1301780 [Sparassis crispa]GBE88363.1 hypothetical protein SCP_1301780 [Sparassis crispa]
MSCWEANPRDLCTCLRVGLGTLKLSTWEDVYTSSSLNQSKIPFSYNSEDGSNLRKLDTTNFPETATYAVNFGPGGLSGIGPLTTKGVVEMYDAQNVKREEWWSKRFMHGLVKTSDGSIDIDTPFSHLLGKPPIMVAGMTPTTVKASFVSTILDAGYHVELAGGGHYNVAALRVKVAEIQRKIPAGVGLTLNSLYINPRQFGFQFPLWQEIRREGLPIEGFCVTAGIPRWRRKRRSSMAYGLLASSTSLSSPVPLTVSTRSSTLPPRIPTSQSFFSGQVDVPVDTTRARTSTSPSS